MRSLRGAVVFLALALAPAARAGGLLDAAIELARRDHPTIDAARVRAEVARLAARYAALRGDSPASGADAFRALLFDEEKFEACADFDSAETLHVDSVLASRRGNCLSLSLVALLVAEAAGAPLRGVAIPNHFLVRFDDGAFRRNLELTRRGEAIADDDLRTRLGPPGTPTADSIYLRNLTSEEVAAVLLHNRGFVALAAGRRADAEADFRAAIEKLPALPEASRNLGVLLGESGRHAEAIACFDRALALFPADADALVNRAISRHARGDAAEAALADLDAALLVDPGRERARELARVWRAEAAAHVRPLSDPPPGLEPGLLGAYFRGVEFDERIATRVDRDLDFEWLGSPARGVPADRFSVRWEGFFRAPAAGTYSLFLVANDGVRLAIDGATVLESFTPKGNENWYGSGDLRLEAGYHPLRVELFEDGGSARIILRVGMEGREAPLPLAEHLGHAAPAGR